MVGPNGVIHALIGQQPMSGFFPHSAGGLVTAPDGQVFGLDAQSLERLTTTRARTCYQAPGSKIKMVAL
jgi:hypothetical protein